MKKGINIWSFPAGTTIEQAMRMAKHYGYEGIELSLEETGPLSLQSSDSDIKAIRSLAYDNGIEVCSLATGLYWTYSFSADDSEIREKAKNITRFQLHAAKLLDAGAILVVPGCVGADFIPGCKIVSYDVAYERALEALRELAIDAGKEGIIIAIENVWNKFLLSPLEMRDFLDKIDSKWVRMYLDTGNVVQTGYPEQWVKILGTRIARVHIKDFSSSVGNINGFVSLLCGDVNFDAVTDALREVNYNGYLTAEMNGFTGKGDIVIAQTIDALRRIIGE